MWRLVEYQVLVELVPVCAHAKVTLGSACDGLGHAGDFSIKIMEGRAFNSQRHKTQFAPAILVAFLPLLASFNPTQGVGQCVLTSYASTEDDFRVWCEIMGAWAPSLGRQAMRAAVERLLLDGTCHEAEHKPLWRHKSGRSHLGEFSVCSCVCRFRALFCRDSGVLLPAPLDSRHGSARAISRAP